MPATGAHNRYPARSTHHREHGPAVISTRPDWRSGRATRAASTFAKSGRSPAPKICGRLARICSIKVEPDRGIPTINTGVSVAFPSVAARLNNSTCWADSTALNKAKVAFSAYVTLGRCKALPFRKCSKDSSCWPRASSACPYAKCNCAGSSGVSAGSPCNILRTALSARSSADNLCD